MQILLLRQRVCFFYLVPTTYHSSLHNLFVIFTGRGPHAVPLYSSDVHAYCFHLTGCVSLLFLISFFFAPRPLCVAPLPLCSRPVSVACLTVCIGLQLCVL